MAIATLVGVGVDYGPVAALRDVDLEIEAGQRVTLLGPSGAGKSTLLGVLGGRIRPDRGTATVLGHATTALTGRRGRELRRRIGTVHQDFALTDSLRVVHNVNAGRLGRWSLWQALRSLAVPLDRQATVDALARVGVADTIDARTADLSGGQRQRVAIARVLIQDPDLVLADEPAASLDPTLAELSVRLLTDASAAPDRALVMSLHDPELALAHSDRIIGLRDGRVVFDAEPAAVDRVRLAELYLR